uniref:NB-ARC domain-containing protein n=1 Tax=Oryza punctata TaxID=4537 RepID=A0A0E0LJ95_ORYPU
MLRTLGRASPAPVTIGDDELAALRSMLRTVHTALHDAQSLSVTDRSVRLWLTELGDLEYRAEDVCEELEYECRRAAQLEDLKIDLLRAAGAAPAAATGKRKREIDDIWARYKEIASDRKRFRLRPGDGVARRPAAGALVPSSSLPRGEIEGRERDFQRVTDLVCRCKPDGGRNYAIVANVGMAGVGKTSLVQHVVGEEVVLSRFDLALWVWVSQEFDVVGVTAKIVEAITRTRPDCSELSGLHGTMVEHMTGKRCLLVLDDVWDDNPIHWDTITAPLSCCAPGSTVVVTTRSKMVAKMVTPNVYHLGCLSDEQCWLVCQRRASRGCTTATIDDELTSVGQQIAKKCRGVPLAAEAAGTAMKHLNHQEALDTMIYHPNLTRADKMACHLSIVHDESNSDEELLLKSFCGQDLRTFLFLARMEQIIHGEMPSRRKIVPSGGLVTDFECLRALDLSTTDIVEVPKSIGSLIHLRYLGLDNTGIQMLPESVGALFHLQIMKLNHCSSLTQLPQYIKLLLNLRCLEIAHSNVQMSSGIRVLTSLQKLPVFVVGNGSAGCGIEELDELVNLRGHLYIIGLSNLDAAQATNVNLWKKEGLQKLTLEWCDILQNSNMTVCDLQANEGKSVLDISCRDIMTQQLRCCSASDLIQIWRSSSSKSMPSVKLVGDITSSSSRSTVSNVLPALESLKFKDMGAWEE